MNIFDTIFDGNNCFFDFFDSVLVQVRAFWILQEMHFVMWFIYLYIYIYILNFLIYIHIK